MGRRNKNQGEKKIEQSIEFNPPRVQQSIVSEAMSFSGIVEQNHTKKSVSSEDSSPISEGSDFSVEDFQEEVYTQKVQFTVKQWLLLGMSKIIPHSDNSIKISMKRNEVSGPKENVQKFCKMAKKEIESMKMKVLKFKCEISCEEILHEMDNGWRCRVFTCELLRKVSEKIQQLYDIKQEMNTEIKNLLNKNGINNLTRFLWIEKNACETAQEMLKKMHKQYLAKTQQKDSTLVSILNEFQKQESKVSRQNQSNQGNSMKRSSIKGAQNQQDSNSSSDYSKILESKIKAQTQKSSRINTNTKKQMQKMPPKLHSQASTKSLIPMSNNILDDSTFTIIEPISQIRNSQKTLSRTQSRYENEETRMPRRRNNRQGGGRREGQQRGEQRDNRDNRRRPNRDEEDQEKLRRNRYNGQSEEDDRSFEAPTVPEQTRFSNRGRRGNRQRTERRIIFTQEYPQKVFIKQHFKEWSSKNKTLKYKQKYVLEINQKFCPTQGVNIFDVTFYGQDPKKDIIYAINLYFNFEKLIKIEEQAQIRDKMIDKFTCDHPWLKVEYKKIFTREKFPRYEDLRKLAKKDNTAQYMNKYKNVTHCFLVIGLMTQVADFQGEIAQYIKEVKNTCRRVDVQLRFFHLNEFMRRKQVHGLIQEAVTEYLTQYPDRFKLHKITPALAQVLVEVELYKVQERDVNRTKQDLVQKLEKLIDFFQIDQERYLNSKKSFDSLMERFSIFKNAKKGLTMITKSSEMKNMMVLINEEIKKSQKTVVKQFAVKQKSQLTLCKDFLTKKLNQPEYSSISLRFEENTDCKIVLIGQQILVADLQQKLQEFYDSIETKICEYNMSLTDEQLEIIEKDKKLQKKVEEDFKIALKFKYDYKMGAKITIEPHQKNGIRYPKKVICFEKEFNFETLTADSVFFFRNEQQINSVKQAFILPLKNHINTDPKSAQPHYYQDKVKQCYFIYGYQAQPEVILESCKTTTSNTFKSIYMYLMESSKSANQFIKEMIYKLFANKYWLEKEIQINIVCKKSVNLRNHLLFKEGKQNKKTNKKRRWFTIEGNNKLYYSEAGNKKIEEAFLKKVNDIELTNQDLNLTNISHKLDFQTQTIVHIKSGKSFPIKKFLDKITFTLDGVEKQIPDSQFKKIPKSSSLVFWSAANFQDCELSIGFYKIDFGRMVQTNLFSKFQRNIGYDQIQVKDSQGYDIEVNYDIKSTKLGLEYSVENSTLVKKAEDFILQSLSQKIITKNKAFDNQFTLQLIEKFSREAQEQNVKVKVSHDKKSFILTAYNDKNIENFLRILSHLAKTDKKEIQYPPEWQPQTQEIQTFIVPPNSAEFNKVQAAFTLRKITQLVRIQNKIVFRKFIEEKNFLKELNDGKEIKQMLLYHGTRGTDPKIIYQDKEECFNINYTSDSNLLGKGTYFAERSEYSMNYSYVENKVSNLKSMFYCRVLVGDSQKCLGHNGQIKDTDFKDQTKRIRYESMTDFLQGSNVFVVYKNRRAYPLYLIKYQ